MLRSGIFATLILAVLGAGCASQSLPKGEWLAYERVDAHLRRTLQMRPGQFVATCGKLIHVGRFQTAEQLTTVEEIIVTDAPSDYFDRWSGQLVAQCGFWFCSRHSTLCRQTCPVKEWTCQWDSPSR